LAQSRHLENVSNNHLLSLFNALKLLR